MERGIFVLILKLLLEVSLFCPALTKHKFTFKGIFLGATKNLMYFFEPHMKTFRHELFH